MTDATSGPAMCRPGTRSSKAAKVLGSSGRHVVRDDAKEDSASWKGSGRRMSRALGFAISALLVLGVSACGTSTDQQNQVNAPAATPATDSTAIVEPPTVERLVNEGAVLVDVRTPEEFASGHLRGALNIDLAAPDFADQIDQLDRTASYVVYCASGNRAGQAIELMVSQDFADVVNGGGYDVLARATSISSQPR